REIILVAGKGGVGKTTCAAALALALARDRPVALVGTDPAGSLADVLGVAVSEEGTRVGKRLRVRELDAEAAYGRFREDYRENIEAVFQELGVGRSLALDRHVLEELWSLAPPGMDEIFALVRVLDAVEEEETVVVDAAPTGHFLRLLAMPELAADWTRQVLRLMVKVRELGGLEGMMEGLLGFARRLRRLRETLASPERSGVLLVTLEEPVVRAETERLGRSLTEAGVVVAAVLVNRRAEADAGAVHAGATHAGATHAGAVQAGAAHITAPELTPAPRRPERLLEFFDTWTLAENAGRPAAG
ncbi:MAG TPA: TRC40/GET3/ArsA family transport-energizing ATPase, partial [Longimicrobiales bacterium]|nr:TRC40/GET3/ArsA family transport-energizing ATPase [Longimicrobiales bacterium]